MKFINQLLVCLALILLITPVLTFAQNNENSTTDTTPGTVLAEINISNAAMEQTKNIARVSFEVENLGSKPQVGIIYGIEIIKASEEAPSLVDVMATPEVRAIPANGFVATSLEYDGSHLPAGVYEVWVIARTSGGLVLGIAKVQDFVSANNQSLEIKADTCLLKVDNETYFIEQGIDVSPTEEVMISCEVKNGSSEQKNFKPDFVNHERTVYGPVVDMSYPEQAFMMLEAGESKNFDFELPKATRPQAYDAVLSLVGNEGELISNSAFVHYVVQGESGTVQNITFDKAQYKAGENINLDILWSIAADNFPESRSGGTSQSEDYFIDLTVTGADELVCSEGRYPVGSSDHTKVSLLSAIDCISPTAKVVLVTASGAILDTESVTVVTSEPVPVEESVEATSAPLSKNIYLIIGLFAVIGVVLLLWYGRKHHNHIVADSIKGLVLALVLGAGFLGNVGSAEAVTWSLDGEISGGNNCLVNGSFGPCPPIDIRILTATVNLNRTTFAPGETATLSGTIQNHVCSNLYYELNANFQGADIALFRGRNRGTSNVSNTFTVPTRPGRYTVNLGMCYTNISNCASQSLTFTVSNPAVAGRCGASHYSCSAGTSANNNNNATNYTWRCNGLSGGSNASCSETKVNGSCGVTRNSCTAGIAANGGQNATQYTWSCNSPNGGSNASCSAFIPPTVTLTPNPALIGPGSSSNLSWTTSYANSCTASGGWSGAKSATGGTESVSPSATTAYTIACTGQGGSVSATANVTLPSGSLTATACAIPLDGTSCNSTVSWRASNFLGAVSVLQGTTSFSGATNGSASRTVTPANRTFTLDDLGSTFQITTNANATCATGGIWVASLNRCAGLPQIIINADPEVIRSGDSAEIEVTVDSPYDLTCTLAGGIDASDSTIRHSGTTGSVRSYTATTRSLTAAQVVNITCVADIASDLSNSAETRVNVVPVIQEI